MFLFLDKPQGISSFKFLYDVKKANPWQKVGHAGTLDPMATGLMIVAVGRESTKQLSHFVWLDKRYEATIDLSLYTDTRDDEHWDTRIQLPFDDKHVNFLSDWQLTTDNWQLYSSNVRPIPTLSEIINILDALVWEVELPIPAFSAKKVWGKKLYDLARKGEDLQRVGMMKIFAYSIIDYSFPLLKIQIHVGSGTYIRSIWVWVGSKLGLWGSLVSLRRTQIWAYNFDSTDVIVSSD